MRASNAIICQRSYESGMDENTVRSRDLHSCR